jgi:hypothetical protein
MGQNSLICAAPAGMRPTIVNVHQAGKRADSKKPPRVGDLAMPVRSIEQADGRP